MQPISQFLSCLFLILPFAMDASFVRNCHNRLDIVIAVDATSSLAADSFEKVKTEVKGFVSSFIVGQADTRLALVSFTNRANVLINFDKVESLADFHAAVDKLTHSTDTVKLSEGIKTAKDSVLNTARAQSVSKILILVKDRRSLQAAVSDSSELALVASEANAVKSMGASIHAVGVGGLWNKHELEAIFGTEYLLFKNRNKAMESVKSYKNTICFNKCERNGNTTTNSGLCYHTTLHKIIASVNQVVDYSKGVSICRTQIKREFESCTNKRVCNVRTRNVGVCNVQGKVTIVDAVQIFDRKLQTCVEKEVTSIVDCADALNCNEQIADIIFILDKSGSIGNHFRSVLYATQELVKALNIGPKNVRIGVLKFGTNVEVNVELGSLSSKDEILDAISRLDKPIIRTDATFTNKGLQIARDMFAKRGRRDVDKYVIVITDGRSSDQGKTMDEAARIKNAGVTVYSVGVGQIDEDELNAMSAPESSTNTFIFKTFRELNTWSKQFARGMCVRFAAPNSKLCDENVYSQTISECILSRQQFTRTDYKYNENKKCIKVYQTVEYKTCRHKCVDPIDGNEYFEGETWTSGCHKFKCDPAKHDPFTPFSSKCMAADGTCKDEGSVSFRCLDDQNAESDNCKCVNINGSMTLVIEKQQQ